MNSNPPPSSAAEKSQPPNGAWQKFVSIMEMIKFSHTIFAMPFALLAAAMAWTLSPTEKVQNLLADSSSNTDLPAQLSFSAIHLLGIIICMVGARSAAMGFNRLADRKIDGGNPRTAGRHLPAGKLSAGSVWIFVLGSSLLFLLGTACFLPNRLPLYLSLPVLAWLLGYSYAKRFTALAHYWLGIALMLAPICVWIALRGQWVMADWTDLVPSLFLGLGVFFWVGGFDIIYACQDYQFDKDSKLNSIPVRLGLLGSLRLAAFSHLVAWLFFLAIPFLPWGPDSYFSYLYLTGIVLIGFLLLYQHWIVDPNDLSRVNIAFFNTNAIISVTMLVVGCLDLWIV